MLPTSSCRSLCEQFVCVAKMCLCIKTYIGILSKESCYVRYEISLPIPLNAKLHIEPYKLVSLSPRPPTNSLRCFPSSSSAVETVLSWR